MKGCAKKYQARPWCKVDIVFGMATWTHSRDVAVGSRFVVPTFFDRQVIVRDETRDKVFGIKEIGEFLHDGGGRGLARGGPVAADSRYFRPMQLA